MICFQNERKDVGENGLPAGDDLFADGYNFFGETFEGVSVGTALFEEGVSGAKCFGVALKKGEVGGLGLGKDQVDETSATTGRAFNEENVVRAKYDGAEDADKIGEFANRLRIDGELALTLGPVDFYFVAGLGNDFGA